MQAENTILYDTLTGLPNRQCFEDRLQVAIRQAKRYKHRFAVMALGLDGFSAINEGLGYSNGDKLLQMVAQRLNDNFRESDTLARLGSDEFFAIFHQIKDLKNLNLIAQHCLDLFDDPFVIDGEKYYINASMGLASFPVDGSTGDNLLKFASTALVNAKQHGKNHFELYNEHMCQDNVNYLMLSNDLHHAISRGELYLVYQPLIDTSTPRVTGVEALLRWQHPKLGMISPTDFIPIAEKQGFIMLLSDWVMHQACRQLKTWQTELNQSLMMSVNISAHLFEDPFFTDKVKQVLSDTGINARDLRLEITESTLMHNPVSAIKTLNELHALGINLAVDDFGTGYSSLSYLKNFPVNALKLDRSFILDIESDNVNIVIIKSMLMLAEGLQMQAIVEGVETDAQYKILHEIGIQHFQGYHFSRPLNAQDCETYIKDFHNADNPE